MISSNIAGSLSLHHAIRDTLTAHYGQREAESLSVIMINYFFEMGRTQILMDTPFTALDEEIVTNLNECLKRLLEEEPIQHILGETEFFGRPFYVNNQVLIPRPETEELVDWIIKDQQINQKFDLLDIGTGSGCIAISLKAACQVATITGLDVSKEALEVAKDNAELNEVGVHWVNEDIRTTTYTPKPLDIIVSNPPYITQKEKADMQANVLDHDPHLALFVEDKQPLEFYIAIANFAHAHLKTNGRLYFEINEHFGQETVEMLKQKGFKEIELKQDLSSKDRMIKAIK